MGRTVVLQEGLYPPRMNWRFCHELAHILLDHPSSGKISLEQEQAAENLATELMLPTDSFRSLSLRLKPPDLKELFPHASWEAIGRRWAEFRRAVMTIFDNYKLVRRWAPSNIAYPRSPTTPELDLIKECYLQKLNLETQVENLKLYAYYIDEGRSVERVLLLTEIDE